MKTFNEENFTELLTKCNNNAGYKGVIILSTLSEVRQFIREIWEIHKANPISGVKTIRTVIGISNYTPPKILFTNNSSIDVVISGESRRGIRYNDILCSTPFESFVLDMVRNWEIDYRSEWKREYYCDWELSDADPIDDTTDTTELDNFLNEFIVNS